MVNLQYAMHSVRRCLVNLLGGVYVGHQPPVTKIWGCWDEEHGPHMKIFFDETKRVS